MIFCDIFFATNDETMFNIMEYFDLTPTLFFAPMDDPDSLRGIIGNKLLALPDEDLEKVSLFIEWIKK